MHAFNLQDLEVVEVFASNYGIYVFAKYPQWFHVYNFFIDSQGKVKGKADSGEWLDLTSESGSFIQAKVQSRLLEGYEFH